MVVARSGGEGNEGMADADQSTGGDRVEASIVGTRVAIGSGEVAKASAGVELTEEGWSADEHPSTMTQHKLGRLREEYGIPSNIILRALAGDERSSTPSLGWVTLCADMLKQGVRLPLSSFPQEWMARFSSVWPHIR